MESKASMKRNLILKSAKEFILQNDFNDLTLDAVAKQSEISKGGLLYHYPNKESLLVGLTQYIFDEFTILFDEQAKKDPIEKGKWCRALIETIKEDLDHNAELNVGIIAASIVTATIIRLAIDGLYYSELFNIAPLDDKMRGKVIQQLINMTI